MIVTLLLLWLATRFIDNGSIFDAQPPRIQIIFWDLSVAPALEVEPKLEYKLAKALDVGEYICFI